MTVLDHPSARDLPLKSAPVAWKLIVAAESPWNGEIYTTRGGRRHLEFSTVETFGAALLAITGWPLERDGGLRRGGSAARRPRPGVRCEYPSPTGKFVIAADRPWSGEVYRTRPGLGRLPFDTFGDFLRAVLAITGWSLDDALPPAAGARPVSRRVAAR